MGLGQLNSPALFPHYFPRLVPASDLFLPGMITYERYTELLSKQIHRTITDLEKADVKKYEAAQPKTCPTCRANVWTFLEPYRVAHDVERCGGKAVV